METVACNIALDVPVSLILTDLKKVSVAAEVAAEAEKETGTDTETEIGRRTGRDGTVRVPGPGRVPETVMGTEIDITAKEATNIPVGLSALPAPKKSKKETLTAGRTNMWIALLQRNLLLVTSTTGRSPASCSLGALFNWKD